jgi:hypothetical protein
MARTSVTAVRVGSEGEMEMAIASYISQGFLMSNRSPTGATMFKKKEFSIPMLVVGFILCVVPLIIYLFVYEFQSDKMVQIQLVSASQAQLPASSAPVGMRSADGQWWWDGSAWQPMGQPTPPAEQVPPPAAAASEWLPAPEPPSDLSAKADPLTPPQEAKPPPIQ